MPELMLRPGWPSAFRRTVKDGKKTKVLLFPPNQPIDVTDDQYMELSQDIGVVIFDVERDEKNRPRYVEIVASGENF